MSDQEIRSAETDESSRLANEDGERLIQMLSVIASNVDKAYPGVTEDPTTGATVVAVPAQGQHGFDQVSNLLTAIAVSSSSGQLHTEAMPTIVQIDHQNIAMVQQEVVVGAPDLIALPDETVITIQPLQHATEIPLEEVHALHQLPQHKELVERYSKKMTFMTNYRDYTIADNNGRILIGERMHVLSTQTTCKMVPVTDVSTGHKFEYQYRPRGTIKRYEGRSKVVYFIGQISNERILALFYQTVYQLVCKVGKIDLDKDYTSGKRVLSTYFSSFGPSTSRTIRTPIEKLTYMKLLIVGDVDMDEEDEENIIILDDDDGTPAIPSEKLKRSSAYKKTHRKKSWKKPAIKVATTYADNSLESIVAQEGITVHDGNIPEVTTVVKSAPIRRGRGRPPKKCAPPGVWLPKKSEGSLKKRNALVGKAARNKGLEEEADASSFLHRLSERGSSKRKVKRPSKLSDYYDFTKKIKKEPGLEEDDSFSDKEDLEEPAEEPSVAVQKVGAEMIESMFGESVDESALIENENGDSAIIAAMDNEAEPVAMIENDVQPVHQVQAETTAVEDAQLIVQSKTQGKDTDQAENNGETISAEESEAAKDSTAKAVVRQKVGGRVATKYVIKKKRGPGRPRKHPPKDASEFEERTDIDELVMQKKKYPSCQFQRASTLKRFLCQACLTNHENPVEEGESSDNCPILNARQQFHDQAATENGSSACSLMSLPTSLSVKVAPETRKLTVCAGQEIPIYTEFGPLVGILLSEDDIQIDTDLSHVWFLQHEENGEKFYLYTGDENASNWCHYLTPVPPSTQYNTVMVLREEGIFFTTSQRIPAGSELKVFVPYFGCKSRPVAAMNQQECLHCKWSFQSSLDYQKHYHIFHPGGFTKQKQKCRLCNRTFPGMKDLQQHMEEKHEGQGAFQCDECTGTFPNPARLRIHKRDVHPPPEAAVKCDKCGKVYRTKRALANHNTNVHSEFKFACEVCGKWFDRRSTLLRHQRLHSGKSAHFCDRCGKGFRDLHNLKVHTLTHSGVRPFSCQYCQNCSFSTRTCLKIHYERFHKLSEDIMPELARTIPFTMEAYSGTLPPVEKPAMHRTIHKLVKGSTAGMLGNVGSSSRLVRQEQQLQQLQQQQLVVETPEEAVQVYAMHEADEQELPPGGQQEGSVVGVLPGESLLRPEVTDPHHKEVHLHIEDDQTMHIEQVVTSEDLGLVEMPGVVVGPELMETEQLEGDHCYYALNVDGQQVLVPATEEVCVIVENDNIITLPQDNV